MARHNRTPSRFTAPAIAAVGVLLACATDARAHPTTQPATQPSTQPATQPSTQPADEELRAQLLDAAPHLRFTNAVDSAHPQSRVGLSMSAPIPELGHVAFTLTAEAFDTGRARLEIRLADGKTFMLADHQRVLWVEPRSGDIRWTPGSFALQAVTGEDDDGESADIGFVLHSANNRPPTPPSVRFEIDRLLQAALRRGADFQHRDDGAVAITASNRKSRSVFVPAEPPPAPHAPCAFRQLRFEGLGEPDDTPAQAALHFEPIVDAPSIPATQAVLDAAAAQGLDVSEASGINLMLQLRRLLGVEWSEQGAASAELIDAVEP
ncbi:MAG: hypothetical protein AAGA57_11385 [Planctomycetota bacterium]